MSFKMIKDTFNHSVPITIEEFWKQQIWILIFGFGFGIPGVIFEKKGASIEVICYIALLILGVTAYIEFIFIVKRYRALGIPAIWACLFFIPPLNLFAFITAVHDQEDWYMKYWGKFLYLIKEDKNV